MINDSNQTIFIKFGILYVQTPTGPKLIVPTILVSCLLAYHHLITAHGGIIRLTASLHTYYFKNKAKLIKELASRCLACQLVNTSSKREEIGLYPVPKTPFQVVCLDLAENLNPIAGYSHMLIAIDPLSDGTYIFPLKSKSCNEVGQIILYSLLQIFPIQIIISDNGPAFANRKFTKLLATLGIERTRVSALSPASRGLVESRVKLIKTILKKYMTSQEDYTWRSLGLLATKLLNNSISPKTGHPPNKMIFGHYDELPFLKGVGKIHPLHW